MLEVGGSEIFETPNQGFPCPSVCECSTLAHPVIEFPRLRTESLPFVTDGQNNKRKLVDLWIDCQNKGANEKTVQEQSFQRRNT